MKYKVMLNDEQLGICLTKERAIDLIREHAEVVFDEVILLDIEKDGTIKNIISKHDFKIIEEE